MLEDIAAEPTDTEKLATALDRLASVLEGQKAAEPVVAPAPAADDRLLRTIRGPHGENVRVVKGQAAVRHIGGVGYGR